MKRRTLSSVIIIAAVLWAAAAIALGVLLLTGHVPSVITHKPNDSLPLPDGMAPKAMVEVIDVGQGSSVLVKTYGDNTKSILIDAGEQIDEVIAIGPVPMMKAVVGVTKPHNIKTSVSLNPIMIDGTGMCGCCRVTVDGKIKFACVDGPDFDGLTVDFDELMNRQRTFKHEEVEGNHMCNLMGGAK